MPITIPHHPQPSDAVIERTQLFAVMLKSGYYEDRAAIVDVIREMKARVACGEPPQDVLAEEGLEPDFVFDLA